MLFYNIVLVVFIILLLAVFIRSLPAMIAVGPIPAHKAGIKKALEIAQIKPKERFYDLGCGDGRVLIEAVDRYGCQGVGYELSFPVYLLAWIRTNLFHGKGRIEIRYDNFFKADLENADVIFCFLTPGLMRKIADMLKTKKLKRGARLVSYAFIVNSLKPVKKIDRGKSNWNIYLYRLD